MTRDKISETNAITGETVEREMTVAEQKERDAFLKAEVAAQAKAKAEAEAKEIAKAAILDRIGLTADELKTILG